MYGHCLLPPLHHPPSPTLPVAANMECGCPEYLVRGVAMRLLQCRLRDLHDAGVLSAAQVSALSSQDNVRGAKGGYLRG